MNKIIIITKESKSGEKLQLQLRKFCPELSTIPYYIKNDIVSKSELAKDVTEIFSTWYMPSFTITEIKQYFPSLKAIYYAAGTVKDFAEPFLLQGVRVFSAARANGIIVAQFVAAQIVLANKGYFQAQQAYNWPIMRRGFNIARTCAEEKYGNFEAKIGIIGCGTIGSKVVELLKPYRLDIFIYDPYITNEQVIKLGVKKVEMEELFRYCDVITNHLPDITNTKGILNYNLFSKMKPTATFINTGRGRQVIEKDLSRAMRKNPRMCALLDVTIHEPLWPWSPLYWCKNVFLTPHIAGSLSNEFGSLVEYIVQTYQDISNGKQSPSEIRIEELTKLS